jgi:hypothetical protein
MPRPKSLRPKYCLSKSDGRAFVTLNGKRKYLGDYGSQESRDAYDAALGEWIARGRALEGGTRTPGCTITGPTVSVLINAFWEHAQTYYRKPDGTPTSEVAIFRDVLRPLRRLYAATLAADLRQAQLRDCARK